MGLALLFVLASGAHAGGSCAASLVASGPLARYKITPEQLGRATGEDRRLLGALVRLTEVLDDVTVDRLARDLIENPPPPSAEIIAANPFFAAYPRTARAFVTVSYAIVKDSLGDRLDDFELGLLAALAPDQMRVDPARTLAGRGNPVGLLKLRFDEILANETYRIGLLAMLTGLKERGENVRLSAERVANAIQANSAGDAFTAESLAQVTEHVARGRASVRDKRIMSILLMELNTRVAGFAERFEPPEIQCRSKLENGEMLIYERSYLQRYVERYLIEDLGALRALDAMTAVWGAIIYLDPLPTPRPRLRQAIFANAESLVFPVRTRLRSSEPVPSSTPPVSAPPAPVITPMTLAPVDHFAPTTTSGKKRSRAGGAPVAASSATTGDQPWIAPERDLRSFTTFVPAPRALSELDADQTYEFWFIRESNPHPRRVRFAPGVITWLRENETAARAVLNAIHLGETRDTMPGLKALRGIAIRQAAGRPYEVKIRAKYRPLALRVDGEWQVLRLSQKGDVDRDAQWLEPL